MLSGLVSAIPSTLNAPSRTPGNRPLAGPAAKPLAWNTPLPLPALIRPQEPARAPALYDVRPIDRAGRIMARRLLTALQWRRGQQCRIRVDEGVLALTADNQDDAAPAYVDGQANLRLRAALRRETRIDGGYLLLLADIPSATLLVFPPATLTALLAPWTGPLEEAFPA
ncbi:hypothetical protein ACIHAX_20695 [Nocardia sp. NPDC051929]|uniref:hypothetical protein n=1 Tax=unclassified Nocardia TaxID=2637762 RepID=UPI00343FB101